jgi:hypothetical protein
VAPRIICFEEYRRAAQMGRPRSEHHAEHSAERANRNRTIRLTDECFDAWQFWKNQMGMNYEQSIWYFLKHSPIDLKVPKGIEVRGGRRAPER